MEERRDKEWGEGTIDPETKAVLLKPRIMNQVFRLPNPISDSDN